MSVKARSQNLAYCAWQNDGRLHYGTFEVASLSPATESPGAGDGASDTGFPCT